MPRLKQLAAAAALFIAVGCGSSSSPSPAASLSSSSPVQSAAPATPSPIPQPSPPATAAASIMGLEDWTAAELFLLAGAQPKVRPTCGKAPKLPDGAYDGIQCHPGGAIDSIGFYAFDDRAVMRKLYFQRLAEYKVKPDSGEMCLDGKPGEGVDTPGDEGFELHLGCYVDEAGRANARLLFANAEVGQSVYVGVVGKNGSIGDLFSALFPDYDPYGTGCGWCAGDLWILPGEH
jgi:hypothetical protein